MIDPADTIAIKRAFETYGKQTAVAELRRRFPVVNQERAELALDGILAMPEAPPGSFILKGGRLPFPWPQGRSLKRPA